MNFAAIRRLPMFRHKNAELMIKRGIKPEEESLMRTQTALDLPFNTSWYTYTTPASKPTSFCPVKSSSKMLIPEEASLHQKPASGRHQAPDLPLGDAGQNPHPAAAAADPFHVF